METEQTIPRPVYTELSEGIFQHVVTGEVVLAADVLQFADVHEDSALHEEFEWNDARAACLWRLHQVKGLMASIMLTEDGTEDLQIQKGSGL
jgi:hypothetical protein